METVIDFNLGGSKITASGDCSHEIKRHLLLERKTIFYIKARQHIKKQRGTKEPLDKSERGEGKSWLKAQHSEN